MDDWQNSWDQPATDLPATEEPPRRKGHPIIAWLVIIGVIAASFYIHTIQPAALEEPTEDRMAIMMMQMQARYIVGVLSLDKNQVGALRDQTAALNSGTVDQRLRYVVLQGELAGPKAALNELHTLNWKLIQSGVEITPVQARLRDILTRLYRDSSQHNFQATSVNAEERRFVEDHLGWFGRLALAPEQGPNQALREAVVSSARQTMLLLLGAIIGFSLLGLGGLVGLILFIVLLASHNLRGGLRGVWGASNIYAETFAVWMVMFVGLTIGAAFLPAENSRLFIISLAMFSSLIALAWPVLRGVPWRRVRQEIGLTWGQNPAFEPIIGIGCYAMTIPILLVGILIILAIMVVVGSLPNAGGVADTFEPTRTIAHPIIEFAVRNDWWLRLQVFIVASLAAPIVEETMFRGVLYRHLRGATRRAGYLVSVLFSGTVAAFVFAVIHPQGLLAVPALMALAYGLTIAREWRQTLVPGMVMHGVHNGLLMLIVMYAFGN